MSTPQRMLRNVTSKCLLSSSRPYTKPLSDGKCTTRSYHGDGVFERFSSCLLTSHPHASRFSTMLNHHHCSTTTHPINNRTTLGPSVSSSLSSRMSTMMMFCYGWMVPTWASAFSLFGAFVACMMHCTLTYQLISGH